MKTSHLFTTHPRSVGESYAEHLFAATGFGLTLLGAGFACLLHGLFPFWFERTGSNAIRRLHDRMVMNRARIATSPPAATTENGPAMPGDAGLK